MGLASSGLFDPVARLPKDVILLNKAGASASSWNVRLCKMHTQFSTDYIKKMKMNGRH